MIKLTSGGGITKRAPYLRVEYIRGAVFNKACVHIADTRAEAWGALSAGSDITIEYDNFINGVKGKFEGVIQNVKAVTKDSLAVTCVSEGLKLSETRIKESYNGETSAGIVKRLAETAGFAVGKLDIPDVVIPHIVFDNLRIYQAINQIYRTLIKLGHDMTDKEYWVDNGKFCAGDFSADGSKPKVETKKNLIMHGYAKNGFANIESTLIADMTHSQDFMLNDTRRGISGTFRAIAVTHTITEGAARTVITYKTE